MLLIVNVLSKPFTTTLDADLVKKKVRQHLKLREAQRRRSGSVPLRSTVSSGTMCAGCKDAVCTA